MVIFFGIKYFLVLNVSVHGIFECHFILRGPDKLRPMYFASNAHNLFVKLHTEVT